MKKIDALKLATFLDAVRTGERLNEAEEILREASRRFGNLGYFYHDGLRRRLQEQPRLLELILFLQGMDMRPGGLQAQVVGRLALAFADRFMTKAMRKAGTPAGGCYDLGQCLEVWRDLRAGREWESVDDDGKPLPPKDSNDLQAWLEYYVSVDLTARDVHAGKYCTKAAILTGVERFNLEFLRQKCQDEVLGWLANHLAAFCFNWKDTLAHHCCPDLEAVLIEFMDWHAEQAKKQTAEIETTRKIFREMEFGRTQKLPVRIIGDSRFGKTQAGETFCEMWPGRARLVTVPESNRLRDFMEAHADALGVEYGPSIGERELARRVNYVVKQFGLFIAYDEAHYLIPVRYNKGTPPSRLNWVRSTVIDKGGPCCALFATPQTDRQTMAQYVKVTGYRMEQWLGRMAPALVLPAELSAPDVLAVAKHNFPDLPQPFLKLISARAMQSEGYLKNVEFTAKRARFHAAERGHQAMTLDDVKDAISWASGSAPAAPASDEDQAGTVKRVRNPAKRTSSAPLARNGRGDAADALRTARGHDFTAPVTLPDSRPAAALTEA